MTDEELIKGLRGWHMAEMDAAADRIEELTNTHWQVEAMQQNALLNDALTRAENAEARVEQLLESIKNLSQEWATAAVNREVSEGKLAKAVEALKLIAYMSKTDDYAGWHSALDDARAVLDELEKAE